jgi:hypothetical protein
MVKNDNNYDSNGPSYFPIPTEMLDNKHLLNWFGTFEAKIWFRIYRHAVRGEMHGLDGKIYNSYYKNGKICSYRSLKDIANFLEIKSIGYISEAIKSMIEKGILIPHKEVWNRRSITIYEVATHDKGPHRHETAHLLVYFTKLKAQKDLEKKFFISAHFRNTEVATSEIQKSLIIE